ncbi:MAG TPA: hypothetical protein VD926_06350, partial [Acidimicrobiales bacterium]|nr:hypothetical protein [Acidimicrobiales bacterium]
MTLLLRRAEVGGRVLDVLVEGGGIRRVGPDLRPPAGTDVLEVGGAAVLPGLHDHHLHLLAMAAARDSVDVREVDGPVAFDAAVRVAVAEAPDGVRV